MKINKPILYKYSRLWHRYFSIITAISGILMAFTGMIMKYQFLEKFFSFIDPLYFRFLHNLMSPLFGFSFFVMTVTGLIMYFITKK